MRYVPDPAASELTLWTYKAGLLSKVAHDLCLAATDWEAPLEVEAERLRVEVRVAVRGLRVRGQVERGAVRPLRPKDHAEIEANLQSPRVLDAARHPELRFVGEGSRRGGQAELNGPLTLRGATRNHALRCQVRDEPDGSLVVSGERRLIQSEFGIQPFTALLGALKVKDALDVRWSLRYRLASPA